MKRTGVYVTRNPRSTDEERYVLRNAEGKYFGGWDPLLGPSAKVPKIVGTLAEATRWHLKVEPNNIARWLPRGGPWKVQDLRLSSENSAGKVSSEERMNL